MRSSKRHDSLVPLSRQHHQALMLCLRIHRGVADHRDDIDWLVDKAALTVRFFDSELKLHFQAEEEILFPTMQSITTARDLIDELIDEHQRLKSQAADLNQMPREQLAGALNGFADLLEAHVRKEERVLFAIYEQQLPRETVEEVGARLTGLIGSGMELKFPELLE